MTDRCWVCGGNHDDDYNCWKMCRDVIPWNVWLSMNVLIEEMNAIEAWESRCADLLYELECVRRCQRLDYEMYLSIIKKCECQFGESWHREVESKIPASEGGNGPEEEG